MLAPLGFLLGVPFSHGLRVMAQARPELGPWAWAINGCLSVVGSVLTAYFVFLGKQHTFGGGAVGLTALNIGIAKTGLEFVQCIFLAIFCNALVCMAVWLCFSARGTVDKIAAIIPAAPPPITITSY